MEVMDTAPRWYLEAKNRCLESSQKALEKALEIIEGCDLEDPIVFPSEKMLELKWTDLVIYTFSDKRESIILMYQEEVHGFRQVTRDALIGLQR